MKIICSYCRKTIGESETPDDTRVSHGMCEECYAYFRRQWDGQSLGEYLDRFDVPVLVVDGNVRIVAANQPMADLLGKPEREVFGLLGGEAVECVYSRLEKGCGKEEHCQVCAIRNAVTHTSQTGQTLRHVRCYIERENGKIPFLVSTVKLDRSIQVVLEPATGEKVKMET